VVGGWGSADGDGVSGEMEAWRRADTRAGVKLSLGRGRGLRATGTALDDSAVLMGLVVVAAKSGWTRRMVPRPRVEPATILGYW